MRKYFEEYHSDEDEDYNPTKQEEATYRAQHERKKLARRAGRSPEELYQEMVQEYQVSLEKDSSLKLDGGLELAKEILNSDSLKPNKRVVFAGKEFMLNEETGQLELVERAKNYEGTAPQIRE